jgi:hypothetical protein
MALAQCKDRPGFGRTLPLDAVPHFGAAICLDLSEKCFGSNLISASRPGNAICSDASRALPSSKAGSDIDENLGSALIVVPITPMTVVLNKRVMLMMFVEPATVVMVIS